MDDISDMLGIHELWAETRGDPRVCIAVLDGPVDQAHPSLRGAALTTIEGAVLAKPTGGTASRHGTHVTSMIFGQNGGGIRGIAPSCRGVLIPIFKDDDASQLPMCSQADLGRAIDLAVGAGANIINVSAGELSAVSTVDPILEGAIRRCFRSGVVVVAAAGNEHGCSRLRIPGALPSVLAVGATRARGEPLEPENYSGDDEPNCLLAPGEAMLGALPGGSTARMSGTSYSAAIVSGVAALLLSLQLKYGSWPNVQLVRHALLCSAVRTHRKPGCSPDVCLNVPGAVSLLRAKLSIPSNGPTHRVWLRGDFQQESLPDTGWAIDPRALRDKYQDVPQEKFGTVEVSVPLGGSYTVPDLHYPVDHGRVGMRLLPVSDDSPVILRCGTLVSGYELVDRWLREQMHLGPDDAIYALLSYIRPEDHSAELLDLPAKKLLRKMSHQHLGTYAGLGRTTQVLPRQADWRGEDPLNMKWNADRYPANVHTLSLQGVPQATLNRNGLIVDTVLTAGAKAPVDPDTMSCRTIDINTTLQYYRDSIRGADYLEDLSWFTNCAVHTTIVVNVLLNVPHNESAFQEIFGEGGSQLWMDFRRRYKEITGQTFDSASETYFEPLWRLEGLTPGQMGPLSLREYNAFHAAKVEGRLDNHTGRLPLEPGVGMAWPLETAVDLAGRFLQLYLSFEHLGGIAVSSMILCLRHAGGEKVGIAEGDYLRVATPVVEGILVAEGLERSADSSWLGTAGADLFELVESFDEKHSFMTSPSVKREIENCVERAKKRLDKNPPEDARTEGLRRSRERTLAEELERLRVAASMHAATGFFSTPSVVHQAALGVHPTSPFVRVRTVCTVMDSSELRELSGVDSWFAPEAGGLEDRITLEKLNIPNRLQSSTREEDLMVESVSMSSSDTVPSGNVPKEEETLSPQCSEVAEENQGTGPAPLVYAFGRIGHEFVSTSRRDSIKHEMGGGKNPEDSKDILEYLDSHPHDAASILWTLNLDGAPIYAIEPRGPFAGRVYELLRHFLSEQVEEGVERVSIPGIVEGAVSLSSGMVVPMVVPEIRGMCNWTSEALVCAVCGDAPPKGDAKKGAYEAKRKGVTNFLERVYYEMRNLGRTPGERALNFAATNAFQVEKVYESALREEMELEAIDTEQSPLARSGADCWDVKLMFFYPRREARAAKKVFRFTVDVSDVVPVVVGPMRSWSTPQ